MPLWVQVTERLLSFLADIAWPVATVVLAWTLRSELQALISRLTRAGPSGVEFAAPSQRQQRAEQTNPTELRPLRGVARSQFVAEVERGLRQNLHDNFDNDEERYEHAVYALAQSRVEAEFILIYDIIFGSQIRALELLHEDRRVSIEGARAYFENEVRSNVRGLENWTFEQWAHFLKVKGLIQENDNQVEITVKGDEFLRFLLNARLTKNKPL